MDHQLEGSKNRANDVRYRTFDPQGICLLGLNFLLPM